MKLRTGVTNITNYSWDSNLWAAMVGMKLRHTSKKTSNNSIITSNHTIWSTTNAKSTTITSLIMLKLWKVSHLKTRMN